MNNDEWECFKRSVRRLPRPLVLHSNVPHSHAPHQFSVHEGQDRVDKPERKKVGLTRLPWPHKEAESRLPVATVTLLSPEQPDDPQFQRQLQAGKVKIEARLDLHHMTESEAFVAVQGFMNKAVQRGWRILLIITGRGAVLQSALPRWLRESQANRHVRWVEPAATRHGGVGAYYIVLRRINSKDK
jgi:DNA-nicking Smr family endonuclease